MAYLDTKGLAYLWGKIKDLVRDNMATIDDTLSDTSTNPVQNKVVKEALDSKVSTESFDAIMHRSKSVRKLNTHQRNFADSAWERYGEKGHIENWSSTANYTDFNLGDFGVLYGTNTTTKQYVALVGEVTQVSSSPQMRTLECYQTDEYKEVTEYGVDIAEDLAALQDEVAGKANKSDIPTVPTNVSAFTNDAGYLTEHQDITGKLDAETFNTAMSKFEPVMTEMGESMTELAGMIGGLSNSMQEVVLDVNGKADKSDIPDISGKADKDHTHSTLEPIAKKTYQNIIGTANNQAGSTFWFGQIHPDAFNTPCHVRYRLDITMKGQPLNGSYEGIVDFFFIGGTRQTYAIWNNFYSTSYRAIYYHANAGVKTEALMNSGNGHLFGVALYNGYAPTNKSYLRTITVKVLETDNCTVDLYDEVQPYATWNSTTWDAISQLDAQNNGLRESGDDNSVDRFSLGSATFKADSTMYGTQLILSEDGENYFSIQTKARAVSTANVCTTRGFRPEYILYYSSGTTIAKDKSTATWTVHKYLPHDVRYSCNKTTFTAHKDAYLKMTYSDGLFYLDPTEPVTQTLPTTDDGFYYLRMWRMYTTASGYMYNDQVIYKHNGTRLVSMTAQIIDALGVIENGTY